MDSTLVAMDSGVDSTLVMVDSAAGEIDSTVGTSSREAGVDARTAEASVDTGTPPIDAAAFADACAMYFAGAIQKCGWPNYPDSALPQLEARWQTSCLSIMSLAGMSVTPSTLEACAQGYDALPCGQDGPLPAACDWLGTAPPGTGCILGAQCTSGACVWPLDSGIDGASNCGACDSPIALGQPCGQGFEPTSTCVYPATCSPPGSKAATCVVVEAGAPPAQLLADAGGPCGEVEGGTASCPDGFACIFGRSGPGTCVMPAYAAAGQPCDGLTTLCLDGPCPRRQMVFDGAVVDINGPCPTHTADGQPCSSGDDCEPFAACIDGTCQLALTSSLCPTP